MFLRVYCVQSLCKWSGSQRWMWSIYNWLMWTVPADVWRWLWNCWWSPGRLQLLGQFSWCFSIPTVGGWIWILQCLCKIHQSFTYIEIILLTLVLVITFVAEYVFGVFELFFIVVVVVVARALCIIITRHQFRIFQWFYEPINKLSLHSKIMSWR